jgi:hypothetical protein
VYKTSQIAIYGKMASFSDREGDFRGNYWKDKVFPSEIITYKYL